MQTCNPPISTALPRRRRATAAQTSKSWCGRPVWALSGRRSQKDRGLACRLPAVLLSQMGAVGAAALQAALAAAQAQQQRRDRGRHLLHVASVPRISQLPCVKSSHQAARRAPITLRPSAAGKAGATTAMTEAVAVQRLVEQALEDEGLLLVLLEDQHG